MHAPRVNGDISQVAQDGEGHSDANTTVGEGTETQVGEGTDAHTPSVHEEGAGLSDGRLRGDADVDNGSEEVDNGRRSHTPSMLGEGASITYHDVGMDSDIGMDNDVTMDEGYLAQPLNTHTPSQPLGLREQAVNLNIFPRTPLMLREVAMTTEAFSHTPSMPGEGASSWAGTPTRRQCLGKGLALHRRTHTLERSRSSQLERVLPQPRSSNLATSFAIAT